MSTFAKLFERDGRQVLVLKDETDDGDAALSFTFTTNVMEHKVCTKISFKEDSELSEWDILDRAFADCDEDKAFGIRESSPAIHL